MGVRPNTTLLAGETRALSGKSGRQPDNNGVAARCVLAARDVAAERCRATALDRIHHLQLLEAHMGAVGLAPSRAVIAEDIRDLQSW